jgi:hypothetical protein
MLFLPFTYPAFLSTRTAESSSRMTLIITAGLSLPVALIAASPIQAVRDVGFISQQSPATHDQVPARWSRQDIFTLVSVCVAVIGIFIGVLVASPVVRKWLYTPFRCKLALSD